MSCRDKTSHHLKLITQVLSYWHMLENEPSNLLKSAYEEYKLSMLCNTTDAAILSKEFESQGNQSHFPHIIAPTVKSYLSYNYKCSLNPLFKFLAIGICLKMNQATY
jgi:hypothetical protein